MANSGTNNRVLGFYLFASVMMASAIPIFSYAATSLDDESQSIRGYNSGMASCASCHQQTGPVTETAQLLIPENQGTFYRPYETRSGNRSNIGGITRLCLSCHDGSIANGMMQNFSELPYSLGTNLSDDHPVGISYPSALGARGNKRGYWQTPKNGVVLYGPGGNNVECTSCHDPHATDVPKMLRVSLKGSELCMSCHNI